MSSQSLQQILTEAEGREKDYDWLDSSSLYEKALGRALKLKDSSKAAEIQERIGLCLHRAAMQSESQREFKERTLAAVEAYEKACDLHERSKDSKPGAVYHGKAFVKFLRYMIADSPSDRRELLDDCLVLIGEALKSFEKSKRALDYGRTYSDIPFLLFWRIVLEWDRQALNDIITKGLGWGEKALSMLSQTNDPYEMAKVNLVIATCLIFLEGHIEAPEEKEVNRLKIVNNLSRAVDVFESVGDAHLLGYSHLFLGAYTGEEEAATHFEKVLQCGERTQDNMVLAAGLSLTSYMTYWRAIATENPDERISLAEKAMQAYDETQRHLSIIKQVDPRAVFTRLRARARTPPASHAQHYLHLAMWSIKPSQRQKALKRAEEASAEALKIAEDSDIPYSVLFFLHVSSRVLVARAHVETNHAKKAAQLERALNNRKKAIKLLEQLAPFDYYAQGVMKNHLADIKAELADIEQTTDGRARLLNEAVSDKEKSLTLCGRMTPYFERMGDTTFFAALRPFQDSYATLLTRLYHLSGNPEHLRRAITIHSRAIESATRLDLVSLTAESHWKIGKAFDSLGDLMEAARSYEEASEDYAKAAEKIPQLAGFYKDHAHYMKAWSEIEKAREHHAKGDYGEARENYEQVAELLQTSQRWRNLSSNYLAWARLEQAEDLSRREQTDEAKNLFQEAVSLFAEAKDSYRAELEKTVDAEERLLTERLVEASDVRREYCVGRVALEEAKTLERQGDPAASSRMYGTAEAAFRKVVGGTEGKPDKVELRKEFMPILLLSRAWRTMARAEAEVSPELYLEASQFFDEAKEQSTNEKARLLALGHSSFCRALEAGARFEATRDPKLHLEATNHLERAANYYVKAGFRSGSEYAMATQRLFDAYIYMDNAKREMDPEKKARFYIMAEKVLQTSIGSYLKGKHPAKCEQVQQLLEKVKTERELAISLSEVLHAPTIMSSATSFVAPPQTRERSVGLEKFEHASVQARLTVSKTEARVGEDFSIEIGAGNVGKQAVLLVKAEEVLPRGLELFSAPEAFQVEGAHLDLRGKQLDPLKTEEIRLALRSFTEGSFELAPRIVYIGETGEPMISKTDPATIRIVKEVLPDRVATGYSELDAILLGGIPKNLSVILTSPSCDERDLLIKNFLEAGLEGSSITFYVALSPGVAGRLAEDSSNFYLFICNPQAGKMVKSLPNVFKLKGLDNLTEVNIALTAAFRKLDEAPGGPRRACLGIVSDVLLQHRAVQTRRWLTSLIPEFRSRGFSLLAVMDTSMHSKQEVQAVLDLFDGEINIYEKDEKLGRRKYLEVKRMANQRYLETTLLLQKQKLRA